MKSILIPVEDDTIVEPILDLALLVGQTFGSYIEGVAVTADYPVVMPVDIAIGVPSPYTPEARTDMAHACRERFEGYMTAHSVPRATGGHHGILSFNWRQDGLVEDGFIGGYGRVFDLTILGRPDGVSGHTRLSTVESALFETGKPVLVAPPVAPRTVGTSIAIAWNRSMETSRTVQGAMPFLKRAERVTVLELEDWGGSGPSGSELARALRAHNINAEAVTAPDPLGKAGETILSEAAQLGCDLLVKGAYTTSRLRQMFFGGATSHILARTEIPVLMAH
jgi:nucleotide-binding universal stress UspA family protein